MELKYLRTFARVAELGSFARAARKLGYTRSAITFHVSVLEKELGAPLFEKTGRKMTLTAAGRRRLPYAQQVLRAADRLKNFEADLENCRGELTVGVGESLLCCKMPAVIEKFSRAAPRARLFIRSMNCYDIRDELLSGRLDLGVFYRDVGGLGDSLVTYPMGSCAMELVARPPTKMRHPDFVTGGQKIPLPFLINEDRCIFRQIFEKYLAENNIALDRTIELWSIPTIKNLVKSGMGVTYLPAFAVKEDLECGRLEAISTPLAGRRIHAVCRHHKNKWVSPLIKAFTGLCRQVDVGI